MLREQGSRRNGKMGNTTTHGNSQQNGIGLKTKQHGGGADRTGGTCFRNRTERLRQDLPFLVLQTKELKKKR